MTVELWVYRTSNNAVQHIIGKRVGCSLTLDYQLARDFSGSFGIGFNRGEVATSTTSEDIPLNTWTHLAETYYGTTSRLYKNGVQIASAIGATGTANSATLVIGNSGTCQPFGGSLDEPSVYNRALSPAEIESIANAGLAGKYKVQSTVLTGLVAWFAGDGNANDISGNGNNGTLQGGSTYAVGKVGQGFQFDASLSGSVSVADAPSLNPTAQISVEGWVYPTLDFIFPNTMAIIVNKETNAAVQFEMARRNSNNNCPSGGGIPTGNLAVYIAGISGLPDDCGGWVNGNALLPLNTWSHVAMTYDGANLRAFVNGVNTRTVAATGAIPTTTTDFCGWANAL